jgi:hypothetical protein
MEKKQYVSHFRFQGGRNGEYDHNLEARFELTDEEVKEAIEVIKVNNHLNSSLPEAMYDAIWEAAEEQLFEDAAEYGIEELDDPDSWIPGWEDMTTEELVEGIRNNTKLQAELFDIEAMADLIFKISYPEAVDRPQ